MGYQKIVKYIEPEELPKFFRDLADALEQGGSEQFTCADDFAKIKVTAKNAFGKVALKAKIKSASECAAPDDLLGDECPVPNVKPRYKDLKGRMKSSFQMLVKMVNDGEMPPQRAVDSFLKDSELMCTYPGYGDEFYEDYLKVCDSLRAAYEAQDLTLMKDAVKALAQEKSRCHAKYD